MTTTDPRLADCVLGGYSVVLTRPRPDWARAALPDPIISWSRCLVGKLDDVWLDAYREREGDMEAVYDRALERFGLERTAVDKLLRWYQAAQDLQFDVFTALPPAQEVVRSFLTGRSDVAIVGVGLPRAYVQDLLAGGPPRSENAGFVESFDPVADVVKRDQPLAPGGTVLGFEPLVANGGLACSWLCNGLDRDAEEKLGIQTNEHGLIESLEDAARVVTYIREDGHAEPGLWLPWLLVRYDDPSQTDPSYRCPSCGGIIAGAMEHADCCSAGIAGFERCEPCGLLLVDAVQLGATTPMCARMDARRDREHFLNQQREKEMGDFVDMVLLGRAVSGIISNGLAVSAGWARSHCVTTA